jgi:hypothetical protein
MSGNLLKPVICMLQNKFMIRRGKLTAIKGRKKEWKRKMEGKKTAYFRASNRHMEDKTFEFSKERKKCYRETRAKLKSSSRPLHAEGCNLNRTSYAKHRT